MKAGRKSKRQEAVLSTDGHGLNGHGAKSLIQYTTGSRVLQSGIYEIIHHGRHRQAHEAVLISGNPFPRCEGCGEDLKFRLLRAVPYIFHDEDFAMTKTSPPNSRKDIREHDRDRSTAQNP